MDFYDEMAYGSLEEESMETLWQGEKVLALREKHLEGKWGDIPKCRNCIGYLFMGNGFESSNGRFVVKDRTSGWTTEPLETGNMELNFNNADSEETLFLNGK